MPFYSVKSGSVKYWTNVMSEEGHLPCPGVGIGQARAAYKRRSKRAVAQAGASAQKNNLATITQEEDRQWRDKFSFLLSLDSDPKHWLWLFLAVQDSSIGDLVTE